MLPITSYLVSFFLLTSCTVGAMDTKKTVTLHDKTFQLSISRETIEARIKELGKKITEEYKNAEKPLIFIGVLRGGFMFLSDLVKAVDLACEVDFVQVASYHNTTHSSGTIQVLKALSNDITNRDIIIVEDIIDSGLSMQFLRDLLLQSNPRSIRIAALLDKQISSLDFPIDYVGFTIAPEFVVGYGLDYAQLGRNLPAIYTLVQ